MILKQICCSVASVSVIGLLGACGGGGSSNSTVDPVVCSDAGAASIDEGNVGDFSNDPSTPTRWTLGAGANVLRASTASDDNDYIAFTIGPCDTLDTITVTDFTSTGNDNTGFLALQQGSAFTITEEEATTRISEIFGYRHYGTQDLNQDVLAETGQAQGAIGFTSPLPAGDYSLWLNQTGAETQFTLVFAVSRVE